MRTFVTGGQGFFGAWIARSILRDGEGVTLFDLAPDDSILDQVLLPGERERVERATGDVADPAVVLQAIERSGAERIIHLAGLQIPTCRANPLLGARVNVLGTLAVFEAARALRGQVQSVVYASSAAVAGAIEDYPGPIEDDAHHRPRTHYGVFKQAGEGSARVYWLDHGVPSVGLRPLAVYGVGREVGVSSGPTKAIKAAVLGRGYTIGFTGVTGFNFIEDVARIFVASSRKATEGARALNLPGEVFSVEEFIRKLEVEAGARPGSIACAGGPLPVAYAFTSTGLEALLGDVPRTPVDEGIRRTLARFRELQAVGALHVRDLEP